MALRQPSGRDDQTDKTLVVKVGSELALAHAAGSAHSVDAGFDDGIDDDLEAAIEASLGLADVPATEVEWNVTSDAGDDELFEVITSIEDRLEDLRKSQQQRTELEQRLTERAGELAKREDVLHSREEQLQGEERAIDSRVDELAAERARMESDRAALMEQLAVLQARREELSSADADERARIDERQAELAATEEALADRESRLQQSHDELHGARTQIEQARAQIEADRLAMEAHTKRVVEQQSKMELLRQSLEEREHALAERFEQFEQMQSQMAELNTELTAARDNARQMLLDANKQREENTQLAKDLADRCSALEQDRARVSSELDRARQQLDKAAATKPAPAPSHTLKLAPRKAKRRAPATVAVWLGTMSIGVLATILLTQAGALAGAGAWMLGIAFTACLLASMAIGGRATDPSSLPVALFGCTFGLWFPKLSAGITSAVGMAELDLSWVPSMLEPQLAMGIGVACATIASAFALYLVLGSVAVLGQALFAAIAATLLVLLPDESNFAMGAAVVMWVGIVAAAMGRWAMSQPVTNRAFRPA